MKNFSNLIGSNGSNILNVVNGSSAVIDNVNIINGLNSVRNVLADTIRVAAYARVSTDKDDQANSFESQVKFFTDFINNQNDWELVKVYSDDGLTGTTTENRVGFNSMLDDVLSGKIDFIITKEVSRFARNTVDTLQITRLLKKLGVGVYFVLDAINTLDKDGELRLTLMASLAQDESRKTSERVKWGQRRQMEKGVVFGRDMLGYRVKGGKLYLVEEEAEIVRKIFYKYLIESKGTYVIARELQEEGIRPLNPDGKAKYKNDWSNTVILRILRNEKYVGDLLQGKTYTPDFLDHKKRYNHNVEDMVYIKDHHPEIAIIDRDMWDATQKELARRSPSEEQKSRHSNRYWASGKIYCGECGERFVSKQKKTSVGRTKAWTCYNHTKATADRTKECLQSEWASDKSLRQIVLYILNILADNKEMLKKEILEDIKTLDKKSNGLNTDYFEKKIQSVEKRKQKLIEIRLADEITKTEFVEQKEKLDKELSELFVTKERIEQERQEKENQVNQIDNIIAEIDNALSFENDNMDALLGAMTHSITVYKGHIVEVRIKDLPFRFMVEYKSKGKLDGYRTEILDCKIL